MLIGVGGKARSGKSTVAGHLVVSKGFWTLAFAEPLKAGAQAIFGLTPEQTDGRLKEMVDERWGMTPRQILQLLATEAMRRVFGDDIWVKLLDIRIQRLLSMHPDANIVVSDVRFKSEASAIKSWGGIIIRINRDGAGATGGVIGHVSETELDARTEWDYLIDNNGTIEELYGRVDRLLDALNVGGCL